jgi:hypothetical protein
MSFKIISAMTLRSLENETPHNLDGVLYEIKNTIQKKTLAAARMGKKSKLFYLGDMVDDYYDTLASHSYLQLTEDDWDVLKYLLGRSLKQMFPGCKITYVNPCSYDIDWAEDDDELPSGNCGGCISNNTCDCISGRD